MNKEIKVEYPYSINDDKPEFKDLREQWDSIYKAYQHTKDLYYKLGDDITKEINTKKQGARKLIKFNYSVVTSEIEDEYWVKRTATNVSEILINEDSTKDGYSRMFKIMNNVLVVFEKAHPDNKKGYYDVLLPQVVTEFQILDIQNGICFEGLVNKPNDWFTGINQ